MGILRKPVTILVTLLLFSCGSEKKIEQERVGGLSFDMKEFRLESSGGCQSDTVSCASYQINYPVFSGLSKQVMDSVERRLWEAAETGDPELYHVPFEVAGKSFIEGFERFRIDFPEGRHMGWYFSATVDPVIVSDTLISMITSEEYYTGGAHGGHGTYFINLDPVTGRTIRLKDEFAEGYEEPLRAAGEEVFRNILGLDASASLADAGFEFPEDKFVLNSNYGFTPDGIMFVFNVYEIAPYVMGEQEVLIPYSKIQQWLK